MYQKLTIIGRLGRDPEMKYTPSGQAVTSFSVATDHQYTDKSGAKVKETTWFRVEAWGKQAEICNTYLQKGALVLVEGRLKSDKSTGGPRVWTDKSGEAKSAHEIIADTVRFLGGTKPKSEQADVGDGDNMPF